MSAVTQHDTATARCTPYSALDVLAGSANLSSLAERVVMDGAEGAVLDVTLPQAAPLTCAAADASAWVWTDRVPGLVGPADSPAPVVVLDCRHAGAPGPDALGVGIAVLRTNQVPPGPMRVPLLVDLPTSPVDPLLAGVIRTQPAVVGFHVLARGAVDDAVLDGIRTALQDWHRAGRTARPLLVIRGASLTSCRVLMAALRRLSGALGRPVPGVRVDVTAAVLTRSSTSYVRVLTVSVRSGGVPVLDLDGLPPLGWPLRTADHADGRRVTEVMFRHGCRVASGSVLGDLPPPGAVLVASGWSPRLPFTLSAPPQPAHTARAFRVPGPRSAPVG